MLRKVIGHLPHIAYACLPACGITEIGRHFYKKKRERKGKTNQSTTMCETVGEGGGSEAGQETRFERNENNNYTALGLAHVVIPTKC